MSTEANTPKTYLTDEQHARAEALRKAREVLVARSPISAGTASPIDMRSLAVFILDGGDPWTIEGVFECSDEPDEPLPGIGGEPASPHRYTHPSTS